MKYTKVLRAIVCGYERGGTTMLSRILAQHPKLETGFECGLLLGCSPKDFLSPEHKVFNGSLIKNSWGINDDDLEYICKADNWNKAYLRLRERASVVKNKNSFLFDKTPIYMRHLNDILCNIDEVKVIVIIKQPLGVIWSWIKRRKGLLPITNYEISNMCVRYLAYANGLTTAQQNHPNRIMVLKYSEFCSRPEDNVRSICNFLELDYHDSMLHFEPKFEVHGSTVSSDFINEYKNGLTSAQKKSITALTKGVFSGY